MYTFKQAERLVLRELEIQAQMVRKGSLTALQVPLLLGPVGLGKTAIAHNACEHFGLPLLQINCGENSDATDVTGIPDVLERHRVEHNGTVLNHTEWVLNKYAATACVQPTFLFFDDLDKAPPPIQNAMLALISGRRFRDKLLHPGTLVMGAGNRVDDDKYANEISESLRTRMTVIEMEANLKDFVEYGKTSERIHPIVLGYLASKPEHLHQWSNGSNRFPTPRGWEEASHQLFAYPDPFEDILGNKSNNGWKTVIGRKVGDHIANDFWAWFTLLSKIDVKQILSEGTYAPPSEDDQARSNRDLKVMAAFAAIYVVVQHLTKHGLSKKHKGLERFVADLSPEMQMAFVIQLPHAIRREMAKEYATLAQLIMREFFEDVEKF